MNRILLTLFALAFPVAVFAQEAVPATEDGVGLFLRIFYPGLATLLLAALGWGFALLRSWVKEHVKSKLVQRLVSTISYVADRSVQQVNQTYVDAIKKASTDGLTPEEQAHALDQAKTKAKSLLSFGTLKQIGQEFGDLDSFLETHVEAAVSDNKARVEELPAAGPS